MLRQNLFSEMKKLQHKYELSSTITSEYFEPGMMQYLDKFWGSYDEKSKVMTLRFNSKGTRYEGRTDLIENISVGETISLIRDRENIYNSNNFIIVDNRNRDLGNVPAELCNVIAPLYDSGELSFGECKVSFVAPVTKRNRHAKQGELFIEVKIII